jgi:hypothetical protein
MDQNLIMLEIPAELSMITNRYQITNSYFDRRDGLNLMRAYIEEDK